MNYERLDGILLGSIAVRPQLIGVAPPLRRLRPLIRDEVRLARRALRRQHHPQRRRALEDHASRVVEQRRDDVGVSPAGTKHASVPRIAAADAATAGAA